MTEKDLKRIQSAYESGLDIEIWFDGRWYKFDAREYPNGGFSTTRQYRIVGSAYADIAEKRIADLEAYNEKLLNGDIEKHNKIVELEAQIEKLQKINNEQKENLKKVRVALIQERTANIMNYGKGGVEMFDSMFEILRGVSN